MLDTLMTDLKTALSSMKSDGVAVFRQVSEYEGQFEDISEFTITPPSVFIEITGGDLNSQGRAGAMSDQVSLYVTANHVKGRDHNSILKLIDSLRKELHNKQISRGFMKITNFRRLGNFPGFITYEINFTYTEA